MPKGKASPAPEFRFTRQTWCKARGHYGDISHTKLGTKLAIPVVEMTAYTTVGLPETEQLYESLKLRVGDGTAI